MKAMILFSLLLSVTTANAAMTLDCRLINKYQTFFKIVAKGEIDGISGTDFKFYNADGKIDKSVEAVTNADGTFEVNLDYNTFVKFSEIKDQDQTVSGQIMEDSYAGLFRAGRVVCDITRK